MRALHCQLPMRKAKAPRLGRGLGRELAESGVEEMLVRVILVAVILVSLMHEGGLRECCWW